MLSPGPVSWPIWHLKPPVHFHQPEATWDQIISQDKNEVEELQSARTRLNRLTRTSSLACQHTTQQQADPFCQYNSFVLSLTHWRSAVPVPFADVKADTHSYILVTPSFSVMVGHIQWLAADHTSIPSSTDHHQLLPIRLQPTSLKSSYLVPKSEFWCRTQNSAEVGKCSQKASKYLVRGSSPGFPGWLDWNINCSNRDKHL